MTVTIDHNNKDRSILTSYLSTVVILYTLQNNHIKRTRQSIEEQAQNSTLSIYRFSTAVSGRKSRRNHVEVRTTTSTAGDHWIRTSVVIRTSSKTIRTSICSLIYLVEDYISQQCIYLPVNNRNDHSLFERQFRLEASITPGMPLTQEQEIEAEDIDRIRTRCMLSAEKRCRKLRMNIVAHSYLEIADGVPMNPFNEAHVIVDAIFDSIYLVTNCFRSKLQPFIPFINTFNNNNLVTMVAALNPKPNHRSCRRPINYFAWTQLPEAERLKRNVTRLDNLLDHTNRAQAMAIDFVMSHQDFRRLLEHDHEFQTLLVRLLKEEAQHFWNTYENPTKTAAKLLMETTASLLGLHSIPQEYHILFRDYEAAFAP